VVRLCIYLLCKRLSFCSSFSRPARFALRPQAWRRLTNLKRYRLEKRDGEMALRTTSIVAAVMAAILIVQAWMMVGSGVMVAMTCAFALMIGGPIALLAWFGSLTDRDAKRHDKRRKLKAQREDALLWQRTLEQLRPAWPELKNTDWDAAARDIGGREAGSRLRRAWGTVASALPRWSGEGKRFARSIMGLCVAVVSSIGFSGCGVPAEAWAMVRPGMGTAELVSIAGGPDYVRSNGTNEVWQYCRDFYGRDEGRFARYYTTVLVSNQTVQDIKPYPVLSDAGCQDFYRANF
jgi:hypothetical protein